MEVWLGVGWFYFPMAPAHRKPLFLHKSFAGEAELESCSYFYDTSDDLVRLLKSLAAGSLDIGHLYRGSWFSFEEGLRRFRRGLKVGCVDAGKVIVCSSS
jgi:hypothetical protein